MKKLIEIYDDKPDKFIPQVEVAACYLEIDGKLLLLQRSVTKTEPESWGVPAGKIEKNETAENAARRELFEETSISISLPSQLQFLDSLYIKKPDVNYVYHMFRVLLADMPIVHLSDEHQNYFWASIEDLETLPLMTGAQEILQRYRAMKD